MDIGEKYHCLDEESDYLQIEDRSVHGILSFSVCDGGRLIDAIYIGLEDAMRMKAQVEDFIKNMESLRNGKVVDDIIDRIENDEIVE